MSSAIKTGTCPMCRAATDRQFRPFCSKRCADLDLARWMNGRYAIPGPPATEQDLSRAEDNDAGDGTNSER